MLGGVDPLALACSFLVLLGTAVLGCALAFLLSVWLHKPHEVLLVVYLLEAAVLAAGGLAAGAGGRQLAPSERELYLQARKLLTAEIAACCGIETAAADAWIVDQVNSGPEQP